MFGWPVKWVAPHIPSDPAPLYNKCLLSMCNCKRCYVLSRIRLFQCCLSGDEEIDGRPCPRSGHQTASDRHSQDWLHPTGVKFDGAKELFLVIVTGLELDTNNVQIGENVIQNNNNMNVNYPMAMFWWDRFRPTRYHYSSLEQLTCTACKVLERRYVHFQKNEEFCHWVSAGRIPRAVQLHSTV